MLIRRLQASLPTYDRDPLPDMDRCQSAAVRVLNPRQAHCVQQGAEVRLLPLKMSTKLVSLTCLLLLLMLAWTSESKTVVSIPCPFPSLIKYHAHVARALSQRGHQVWVAVPTDMLENGHVDVSGFNVIPYDTMPGVQETYASSLNGLVFEGKSNNVFDIFEIFRNSVDTLLRNESFISIIRKKNPDLIVIDNQSVFYAMSVIPYRLGIPFALMGSAYMPQFTGVPFSLAEVPNMLLPYTNNMSFFQRLHNTVFYVYIMVNDPTLPNDAVSIYAPEMEYLPLDKLLCKAEIFLVEQDHVLDYPKPTLPNVKLIGGLLSAAAKPLPPDLQSFMDSAKDGAVIVSFGSFMLGVPKHISDKILQVLLQLPLKSVFRSNLTSPDPKKIMTSSWIPQNDLLGHPHTKVFVSHSGKNGQYEALHHAVPMVATPLFYDQHYNAERARSKGFAEVLDINICTAEQMKSVILTVANEAKYKEAALKHSRLFKELYGVPRETAIFWLEHVMEHGGEYMRSAGQQMPWYQFMLLDVLLFIVCVLALSAGLLFVCIRAVYNCFRQRKLKLQ